MVDVETAYQYIKMKMRLYTFITVLHFKYWVGRTEDALSNLKHKVFNLLGDPDPNGVKQDEVIERRFKKLKQNKEENNKCQK